MRNIFLISTFLTCLLFSGNINGQECAGLPGPSVCTPISGSPSGFTPTYNNAPAAVDGVPYDLTITFVTPTTAQTNNNILGLITVNVNYVKIDSIENLPCGLCWNSDVPNNQLSGGQTGCIRVTGTTFDAPGQFKMRIIVDVSGTYVPLNITQVQTNQDASTFGIKYWAKVKADTSAPEPVIDTLAVGNSQTAHGSISTPTVSATNASICPGTGSSTLSVSGGTYYAYAWSNGAYASSVSVSQPGTYTVTVFDNCASATASVTVASSPIPQVTISPNTASICAGAQASLTASGGGTYAWSNTANSAQISVSPSQTTTYTVTVTGSNTCTASASRVVTVNTLPVAAISPGTASVCSGTDAILTASGGSTYVWSNGAVTPADTVSPSSNTTYTVTVTDVHSCTASTSRLVSVGNVLAHVTPSGPTTFCNSGSVTLRLDSTFATYLWSTGETTQSIVVTTAGTYTATVTNGSCQGVSNPITVTISASSLSPTIVASPSLNICPGGSATLDAGVGYTTYAWSNGSPNQTVNVSTQGIYTVTVSQGSCQGSASATLNVGAFPVAVTITPAGPISVCAGTPVSLDAGSGFATYAWSNSATTETIQPTSSATYIVTVTKNFCIGTDTVVLTVKPLPQPVITPAGPISKCVGDTLTLDAGAGFDSYLWNNGSGTETINPSATGVYSATATLNGCTGASDSVSVTFNALPVPVITPASQTICAGNSVTLNAGPGYSAYTWTNGATTQSITVDSTGTYGVSVTQNGCNGSSTAPATVTVNPVPAAQISGNTQNSSEPILTAQPAGATYQWYFKDQSNVYHFLAQTQNDTVSCDVSKSGNYYVIVTQNGCMDTASAFSLVCSGINEISSLARFSIQPNPATDMLTVSYELSATEIVSLSVIDLTGRRVINALNDTEGSGHHAHPISLNNLAPGVYLLNFLTDGGSFNTKFIKQ